jgi:hypothetical protein
LARVVVNEKVWFSLDFRGEFLSTTLRNFYREKRSGTDVDPALDRLHAF